VDKADDREGIQCKAPRVVCSKWDQPKSVAKVADWDQKQGVLGEHHCEVTRQFDNEPASTTQQHSPSREQFCNHCQQRLCSWASCCHCRWLALSVACIVLFLLAAMAARSALAARRANVILKWEIIPVISKSWRELSSTDRRPAAYHQIQYYLGYERGHRWWLAC
jgi:hypothetical protein